MSFTKKLTAVMLLFMFFMGTVSSQILTGPSLEFTHPAYVASTGMNQFQGYADEAFISPGDINGDGLMDYVRGMRNSWGTNGIGFWINNGTSPNISFSYSGDNPYGIITLGSGSMIHTDLLDMDGDADLDILGISADVDGLMVWENTGSTTVPAFAGHTVMYADLLESARSLTVADYNGDGLKDLIIGQFDASSEFHHVNVMINTGTSGTPLFESVLVNPNSIDISAVSLTAVNVPNLTFYDWDVDGDLDIFGMSEADNQVFYLQNTGTSANPQYGVAEFQFSIPYWYNSNFEFLDIDSDGSIEALLGQSTGMVFTMYQVFAGCMDGGACNYDPNALEPDNSCVYPTTYYLDGDNDGFGTAGNTYYGCSMPAGYVSNTDDCDDNNAAVSGPPGDPSVFGQGVWNAYVFDGVYFNTYKGYYVREGNAYNTISDFGWEGSPSEATGYLGCSVPIEYHSVKYKRQGFPASDFPYAITIPSWDDDIYVYVDGNLVWSTSCCANNWFDNVVWTGDLNPTSTVEISYGEYGGGSFVSFIVEPQYPLSITGSSDVYNNACYDFTYYTQVNQDFGVDPSSMIYSVTSANGLVDLSNVYPQFNGSEVSFTINPNDIIGEDVLTFVVSDSMGYSDTLLMNLYLQECPPALEVYGSTEGYHDACTDFDIFVGFNSALGYTSDEMTFVTTFEDPSYVQSSTPSYFDGWDNGAYVYFNANAVVGTTTATTVVTDPLGNSDTLVTLLTFGNCYPVLSVDYNWEITCGDSIGHFDVTYAFATEGVNQSIASTESYNTGAVPNENIVLLSSTDTLLVQNGINFYGTTYSFQVEFETLNDWVEIGGYLNDDLGYNYNFGLYMETVSDYDAPSLSSDLTEVNITLPAGSCDTTLTWDVILNPINAYGAGSTYLTNQHDGTFYTAINGGNGLTTIGVDGNSGADCNGEMIQGDFPVTTISGDEFHVYYGRTEDYNENDPKIYHLWFVPASETDVLTSIEEELCDSRFVLENLSGTANPYFYYLFASNNSDPAYDENTIQSVAQTVANGFGAYLSNDQFDLNALSANMSGIVSEVNSTILNDGNYYAIEISNDFEYNNNNAAIGINDGGDDIYDGGNFLLTNFNDYYGNDEEGDGIPYTNGAVYVGGPSESNAAFTLFVQESCNYTVTSSIENGSTVSLGITVVDFTVVDGSGNESFYSVAVSVNPSDASDVCGNDIDDNCDGLIDENCGQNGCMDVLACNYNADATSDDGTCTYPVSEFLNCDGLCNNDADADGVCDENEVLGCTHADACNYDETATEDDGTCIQPQEEICNEQDDDCDGEVDEFVAITYYADADGDGFGSTEDVTFACTLPAGYVSNADDCDDLVLTYLDSDGDGYGSNELDACGVFTSSDCNDSEFSINTGATEICGNEIDEDCSGSDEVCVITGCTDVTACNYNAEANTNDGSCTYPAASYLTCAGACMNDTDADGVCNELELIGCMDVTACNYNSAATDNANCTYPAEFYLNCAGACINDTDADGVCDELEVIGCMDVNACNYDATATDNANCTYPAESYLTCVGACINDTDADGVCNELEVIGCMDVTACNYNAAATDNANCTYPAESYLTCAGACINDTDADGVCDEIEVTGCTDVAACNYDATATDNANCTYPAESYLNCAGACLNDGDADGVCDEVEVLGCTNATACNYNANATEEDGSCILPLAEVCNEVDDNCNGEVDEFVTTEFYLDGDNDGYGTVSEVVFACTLPIGYVTNADDCDDSMITYEDLDADGFGTSTIVACGAMNNTDCNDTDASINAGAIESCNNIDDDCNGVVDNDVLFTSYYTDADTDGYGTGNEMAFCSDPGAGYSLTNDDCDDTNAAVNPQAVEVADNGIDDNCDGVELGMNEQLAMSFSAYPNPTADMLVVKMANATTGMLMVFNAQGALVMKVQVAQQSQVTLDLSEMATGVYTLMVQDQQGVNSMPIVKL